MSTPARTCSGTRSDGTPCRGIPAEGDKYCAFHNKRHKKLVKTGVYASAETLGVPRGKQVTFDEFLASDNPYDLRPEIALLRTLQVEQREALMRSSKVDLSEAKARYEQLLQEDLVVAGMEEEIAKDICPMASARFKEVMEEFYGTTAFLGPSQFSVLADTIDQIAKTAERAKKINEGIILHVGFKDVHSSLLQFCNALVSELDMDLQILLINKIRAMNLLGTSKGSGNVVDDLEEMASAIDAEFRDLD